MRYRLWQFGHQLDPLAAITIDPFTPPMVGLNQIAQFATYSYFSWGFFLPVVAGLLVTLVRPRRPATRADAVYPNPCSRPPDVQRRPRCFRAAIVLAAVPQGLAARYPRLPRRSRLPGPATPSGSETAPTPDRWWCGCRPSQSLGSRAAVVDGGRQRHRYHRCRRFGDAPGIHGSRPAAGPWTGTRRRSSSSDCIGCVVRGLTIRDPLHGIYLLESHGISHRRQRHPRSARPHRVRSGQWHPSIQLSAATGWCGNRVRAHP